MTERQRGWFLPPASLVLVAGILLGRQIHGFSYTLAACFLAVIAALLLKGWLRWTACIVFSFTIGIFAGTVAFHPSLPPEDDYNISGIVCDEVSSGSFGQVRICLSDVELNGRPFSGCAYWTFFADDFPQDLVPGKSVSFHASLYHPSGAVNPDGYDFRESLLQRGITIGLYGNDGMLISDPAFFSFRGKAASLRHHLSEKMISSLGQETGKMASALLLGMRSLIPSDDRQSFTRLGIAHILSVSGFHVGVLISMLAVIFRFLKLKQKIRLLIYAVFLSLYASLCGMNPPVIRASLLLLLGVEGRILNRPRSGIHLLSAALFLMALFSPAQVSSASFQMTFCAVFGLVWFSWLAKRFRPFRSRALSFILESMILTAGIQLGLLIPELIYFQRFPLLVFFVNIPAMLIAGVMIVLFWIALFLLPLPALSSLVSVPLSSLSGFLLSCVRSLGSLPGLTLWIRSPGILTFIGMILLFTGFCGLIRLRPYLRTIFLSLGMLIVVFSLLPSHHNGTEYIQFSVGNADAAVLLDEDRVYVFDTGEEDSAISGFLRTHRMTPDAVFLTHLHADHAGGLRSLISDEIPVKLLFLPFGAEQQDIHPDFLLLLNELRDRGTEIRTLSRGDVIPFPSGSLTVLWPENGKVRNAQDANHYSLVFRLVLKETVLLHTGDITGTYEDYCASPANILKAAHHGSAASTGKAFLETVSPDVVLLSCRSSSRLESFRKRIGDIPVYGTPESGAVTIRFEEGRYTLIPYIPH